MGSLPSKTIANLLSAVFHSFIGLLHFRLMLRKASYINFSADSSVGNDPRLFMTFLTPLFTDSIALVV
jgi:hypothetical protein